MHSAQQEAPPPWRQASVEKFKLSKSKKEDLKRETMKLWKQSKPPLNVQEHSSGNTKKESFPRRDWSYFFVKNEAACQVVNSACKSVRRVVGTSRMNATVSTEIPRQIIEVEGGESLSVAESKPSWWNNRLSWENAEAVRSGYSAR